MPEEFGLVGECDERDVAETDACCVPTRPRR
jgi:hypothetical protein